MDSSIAVVQSLKLGAVLAVVCLACVLISVPVFSQIQLPNNTIRIGVRTSAYPIGNNVSRGLTTKQPGGLCGIFGQELKQELASKGQQIEVKYVSILNQHLGTVKPRYDGLRKREVDIECGPNSISSKNLKTGQGIAFSNSFYDTGVKLILTEKLAEELNSGILLLNEIKIGVVKESTTIGVLQSLDNINQKNVVYYESGREALNALKANKVEAFASDALIVWTFLKKGVNQPGQPSREPYENYGYTIYPNSSLKSAYLTSEPTEKYGMAVNKDLPFSDDLLNAINNTLNKSKLSSYKQTLKDFETIPYSLFWTYLQKSWRFSKDYIWVIFVPFFWELLIEFSSSNLPENLRKRIRLISAIVVSLLIIFILVNGFLVWVIPLIISGY
ncbi:transporter substrate-binding domain-containing protein [Microcoleus sp. ARI1-B5]|uniref:transporter substrate-binding domain-containing protein n=1 Tax=unclassified Microcoleus TaxID=2642155 RepID=UPI002FD10168